VLKKVQRSTDQSRMELRTPRSITRSICLLILLGSKPDQEIPRYH